MTRFRQVFAGSLLVLLGGCPASMPATTATPAPGASAAASDQATTLEPIITTGADLDQIDRDDLLALFQSSDLQSYLDLNVISDGSGAYFSLTGFSVTQFPVDGRGPVALQQVLPPPGPGLQAPPSRGFEQVRRSAPKIESQSIHIAYVPGRRDQAIITVTIRQGGEMDLGRPGGPKRAIPTRVQQVREFMAKKVDGKWQLEQVGRIMMRPDETTATPTLESLTLQAEGTPAFQLKVTDNFAPVGALPILRIGQHATISAKVQPGSVSSAADLVGLLRIPQGGNQRMNKEADGLTFTRNLPVPQRPGIYNASIEILDLATLSTSQPKPKFTGWGFSFRVQR